ncbi:fibronectin type III domain-containing protein [[Brevibacterium] frigoritolerans]|nr:fibronectin type III domain-containing protein [Peribacillus frigoritolerans]
MHRTLIKLEELSRFILQKWYIFLLVFSFSWIVLSNVYAVESGTQDDPILIDDCYELQNINNNLDAYYKLTQNIDCSVIPSFVPIAEYNVSKFTGTLDGNHYEIKDLTINQPTKASGLFGEVSGTIMDLRLENVDIIGTGLNGALASQSSGVIKNVVASGKIAFTKTGLSGAGIIGFNSGTIEKAQSYLDIEGPSYVGGVVGLNSGSLLNSHSYATINHIGTISDSFAYGGLVGTTGATSIIKNSSSRSTIKGTGTQVGGLVGMNYGKINNSYSNSSITSNGHNVGGAVGTNQGGVIESSYAEGFLSNSSTSTCTGGFIGSNQSHPLDTADPTIGGTIRNSYSTTTISASGNRVGSFAGCSKNLGGVKTTFENSYATGKVTASGATKGGFLGYVSSTYEVTNSFWDKNTTGLATSLGGTGKTTLEMNTTTTYTGAGWDFTNLWGISTSLHNGYPDFIVAPTLPVSPTNLRVLSKTDQSIDLTWDSDSNITNYQIWKDGVLIRQEPSTTFKVENLAANTTYQLKVIAQNVEGDSVPTVINVKTRLSKPTNVLVKKGDGEILVSWDPHNEPSILGYNLYVNDVKVNENPIPKTSKEYLATNLANYQTYKFTVTAIDSTNEESVSSSVLENPIDLTPPEQVKNVIKTYTDNSVTLSWANPLTDFYSLLINRGNQLITETSNNVFLDSNLTPSTTYEYELITKDPNGNLSVPYIFSVHTKPTAPTGVTTDKGDSKILVSWDPHSDSTILGYNLYVNDIKVNEKPLSKTDKEYLVTNLTNYQTYEFTVTAIDSSNEESLSSVPVLDNPIDLTPPEQVKHTKKVYTDHNVILSWVNPTNDFQSVLIYRGNQLITETSDSILLDSALTPSTRYYYKLITKDPNGNLSDPFHISVHTKPVAPTGVTTVKGDGKILVSWDPYNGFIIGFNVYLDNKKVNITPLSSTNFNYFVSGLKNYQTYKFSVAAVGDTNEESAMSEYIFDNPIDLTLPDKVKDIAFKHTSGSILLSWKNPVTDFHSVLIYRDNKLITETSDNIILDSNLNPSTTYTYKLITKDPNGNLSKPYTISAHTKPVTPKKATTERRDSKILNKENVESEKSRFKIITFSPVAEQVNPLAPIKEVLPETEKTNNLTDASEMRTKPADLSTEKEQTNSLEIKDGTTTTLINEQNIRLLVRFIIIFLFFFSALF